MKKHKPSSPKEAPAPSQPAAPVPTPEKCRRCGGPGPVGEDGFCLPCEKALEQACL